MNALLIYPRFPDTFWSFRHALKFIHKRAALPPLGLLTVAAMLPRSWWLRVVDLNVGALTEADLSWADVVLISAMIAQRASTEQVIARCRQAGRRIVAGGPLFTVEPGQFPEVDHLVLNEAEATLPDFLSDFAAGRARRIYRSGQLPALQKTPIPRWDLVDLRHYASTCVQYSRGCPFDCEFCSVTAMFGHRPRVKTPAQIVAELDALWSLGWRGSVFFVDDNFIGNRRSLRDELLPALSAWQRGRRKPVALYTEASINLADDPPLMQRMVEAGFDQVFIGIETPDELALAECNKRQNRGRNLIDDVKRIQRAGLQVQGGFIVGFDHDSPGIFQRQLELIQRSGIVTAMVGMLQAVPGTRLHARLAREGRLLEHASGDNADGTMNFTPPMGRDAMQRGYHWLVDRIYTPRAYYARIRTFLREFRPRRFSRQTRFRDLFAFANACVRLGVLGRERFQFWALLVWTFFRRPRLLPVAITLSIYGHHFRLCSRRA